MLPYYESEENIQEEKTVQYKNCSKCETKMNPDKFIKNKTICRKCQNEKEREKRNMPT